MIFETLPEKILERLRFSLEQGKLVGIEAPQVLGRGVYVTVVKRIERTVEAVEITLKEYDTSGYILKRNKLILSDILSICSFESVIENPYLKELTGVRFHQIIK